MVVPSHTSQSNPTNFSGKTFETINTSVKANRNDGDVFYETPAAQGISGLFVALAIVITVHQARKLSKLNNVFYYPKCFTLYKKKRESAMHKIYLVIFTF